MEETLFLEHPSLDFNLKGYLFFLQNNICCVMDLQDFYEPIGNCNCFGVGEADTRRPEFSTECS